MDITISKSLTVWLHRLIWIMITAARLISFFKDPGISFQWIICALICIYIFTLWIVQKRVEEEEWGAMTKMEMFLLLIEILLQKMDLFYFLIDSLSCIINHDYSSMTYNFLLINYIFHNIYDLFWKYFYGFKEVDDMLYLVLFGMSGILHDLLFKKHFFPLLLWTLLAILTRLFWIWYQQFIIGSYTSIHPDDFKIVSIQCSNSPSGDSGHVYVMVGNRSYEIYKEGNNTLTAHPVAQRRHRRNEEIRRARYYIPFIQYGVLGVTTLPDENLYILYLHRLKLMKESYNASYQSCQEYAFNFVDEICLMKNRFNIRMTFLKSLITAFVLFIIAVGFIIYPRIEIHYI